MIELIDRKSTVCLVDKYSILYINFIYLDIFLIIIQNYFQRLFNDNLYEKNNLDDHIMLLAIYMSILQHEIHQFVNV